MSRQNQPGKLAYPHFALIYIDRAGNLCYETSLSIRNSRWAILTPGAISVFLRAVARSGETVPSQSLLDAGATTPSLSERTLSGQITLRPAFDRTAQSPEELGPDRQYLGSLGYKPPIKRGMRPRRQRQSRQRSWNETFNMRSDQKTLISIRDKDFLYRYYEKVFKNLQQTNCRILSKAYVKLVEPRKHVNYPYNGRKIVSGRTLQLKPDETKPPWWPSGVIHREPDHLLKPERIRLLIHILCELRTSHGVTARRLREADQAIRHQISPIEQLQTLDEVYQVREEEERFQEGLTDGKALVSIARTNLPETVECTANQGSEETSTHETEKGEELLVSSSDPIQDAIVTQSAFVLGDVPSDLSPTTLNSLSYSPSYFIGQYVDPSLPMTTRPRKLRHYPPIFGGSRHFLPESYDERQNCQLQVIPITAPPGTEQYWGHIDNCVLPHYFKN